MVRAGIHFRGDRRWVVLVTADVDPGTYHLLTGRTGVW